MTDARTRLTAQAEEAGLTAIRILGNIRDRTGGWFDCGDECGQCLREGDDCHAWEAFEEHAQEAIHLAVMVLAERDAAEIDALRESERRLREERDELQKTLHITSLAVPLEEDLSGRIDEMLKHLATEQGYTLNGIARLFIETQKRMADDWMVIGRERGQRQQAEADLLAARQEGDRLRQERDSTIKKNLELIQQILVIRDARERWLTDERNALAALDPSPASRTTDSEAKCSDCGKRATREFCYAAQPWMPYCDKHKPQYGTAGERRIGHHSPASRTPQEGQ